MAKHEVGSVDQTRQQMSRAHKSSGDTKKSAATLVNKEEIIQGLKKVHKGEGILNKKKKYVIKSDFFV